MSDWWQQWDDPLLLALIQAAQAASPTVSASLSHIEQSRAARVASQAATLPSLEATGSLTRSRSAPGNPGAPFLTTGSQVGFQSSWEIDLFGSYAAAQNADQQRLEGAVALWHAARVSVAAETAQQYHGLRACERQWAVAQSDAASRAETARLLQLSSTAGLLAPADAALARASAAQGQAQAVQQRLQCELSLKALVALTALPEPQLRQQLKDAPHDLARDPPAPVVGVPAQVLAQRPDVFNAAREVDAAHAEVGSAHAQRYPRLTLNGSISSLKTVSPRSSPAFDTWSIGPLQLTLPLFDGGVRVAQVEAAKARYDNAAAQYRDKVRQAVREVEEALAQLQAAAERNEAAAVATLAFRTSFAGTEARYASGLASRLEREDAHRTLLAAQNALIQLQNERRSAWVALYRALGGGWHSASPAPLSASASASASASTPPPTSSPAP